MSSKKRRELEGLVMSLSWMPFHADETAWERLFQEVITEIKFDLAEAEMPNYFGLAHRLMLRGDRVFQSATSSEEARLGIKATLSGSMIWVMMCLGGMGTSANILHPLTRLFDSLDDLDSGIVGSFLSTEGMHPRSTTLQRAFRKYAVRSADLLKSAYSGRGKIEQARMEVVQRLGKRAKQLGFEAFTTTTLRNWATAYFSDQSDIESNDRIRWEGYVRSRLQNKLRHITHASPAEAERKAYRAVAEELFETSGLEKT